MINTTKTLMAFINIKQPFIIKVKFFYIKI